ncbi:MAG TPA: hypothetical protein VFI74_04250 [Candidatus Saccharimonadales bacterium]|nr:hypothetical protein [Candidatus Saccharimonadales bacterium]
MPYPITEHPAIRACLRFVKAQRLALFVGVCAGSVLYLGKYLVTLGDRGDHYAQTWGMVISLLSLISGVWLGWLQIQQQPKRAQRNAKQPQQPSLLQSQFTATHISIALAVAVIAFTIPPLINRAVFIRWQKQDVTSRVELKDAAHLRDGDTARILLPATKHGELAITITLSSLIPTGSCVAPASITLTPTHDGNDGHSTEAFKSGEVQQLPVQSGTPTELRATVDLSQEPSCAVKMSVSYAQFRR